MFEVDGGVMMPRRATRDSAGYDFFAPQDIDLVPGEWTEIDTGVRISPGAIVNIVMYEPYGDGFVSEHEFMIPRWHLECHPRSGLGFKYMVRFANTTGIIDMDYRQNIRAKLTSDVPVRIEKGKAFMQGIIVPFCTFCGEIEPTEERSGGFGSTDR